MKSDYYDELRLDRELADRGKIYLFGEIEYSSVERMFKLLDIANEGDAETIRVYISSYGGDLFASLAVYDRLRTMSKPVVTVGMGGCFSGAAVVLQGGDVRLLSDDGWLMLHEIQNEVSGGVTEHEEQVEVSRRLLDVVAGILSSRSKVGKDQVLEMIRKREKWIKGEEALSLGFVDGLLPSGKGLENPKKKVKKK